jgi:hypothetical protein
VQKRAQTATWPSIIIPSNSSSVFLPSSATSDATSDSLSPDLSSPSLSTPGHTVETKAEITPFCHFYKQGVLIRKTTLSKPRKRKSGQASQRKREIFGSPFDVDYNSKPLKTGYGPSRTAQGALF